MTEDEFPPRLWGAKELIGWYAYETKEADRQQHEFISQEEHEDILNKKIRRVYEEIKSISPRESNAWYIANEALGEE